MNAALPSDALLLVVACLLVVGSATAFLLARGRQKARYLAMRRSPGPGAHGVHGTGGPAVHQGAGQGPSNGGQGVVRATDLMRLSKDDEAKRLKAQELIEKGDVIAGARLLEEIGLQRYAISALEQARHVDEACAMLVRMNRPNRAGVIYQRNGRPVKAAEQFLTANMPEDAARCYLEAGKDDPGHYRRAADIFEGLGKHAEALEAYARGGLVEGYVQFCLKHGLYEALRDHMRDAESTRGAFAILDVYSTKKLVRSVPLDTRTAQALALWCRTVKRVELIELALRRLEESKNLLALYWSLLPEDFATRVVTSLLQAPQFKEPEGRPFLIRNARALFDAKRPQLAALLYEDTGRLLMAAKCQALAGDPGYALDLLSHPEHGDAVLARELTAVLTPHTPTPRARHAPHAPDVVAAAIRVFAHVDADGDELHTASPFSLTG